MVLDTISTTDTFAPLHDTSRRETPRRLGRSFQSNAGNPECWKNATHATIVVSSWLEKPRTSTILRRFHSWCSAKRGFPLDFRCVFARERYVGLHASWSCIINMVLGSADWIGTVDHAFQQLCLRHSNANMGNPRTDPSIFEGLYHPFLLKSGMVDCWVYHITQTSVQPTGWKWWNCSCKAAVTRNSYHSCTRQIHQTKTKQCVWYEEFKASLYLSWCVKSILHLYINFNSNTDLGLRYAHALNVGWLTNEPWMQNQEQIKQVIWDWRNKLAADTHQIQKLRTCCVNGRWYTLYTVSWMFSYSLLFSKPMNWRWFQPKHRITVSLILIPVISPVFSW